MFIIKLRELKSAKERTERRKITVEEIRKNTNISRATLSKLINSPAAISMNIDVLNKLCNYFNCKICEIIEHIPDGENRLRRNDWPGRC